MVLDNALKPDFIRKSAKDFIFNMSFFDF